MGCAAAVRSSSWAIVIEPWIKGWAVARYHHEDFRVWPQQKAGYDTIQIANPHYRTYVWPEQELMPQEDADRYIAEGASMSSSQLFSLIISS